MEELHAHTDRGPELELLVLGDEDLTTFIADALAFEPVVMRASQSTEQVVEWIDRDADRPRMLIVDFDGQVEVARLRALRERGFRGQLIGIGSVAPEVRGALDVNCVLGAKVTSRELKRVVRAVVTPAAAARGTPR